ncbi:MULTISPECIES: sulfurtransferase TusA family protein [Shewanella]|uniref:sulfurtransferase TusA family protein n=1 Tax=Shewanella TaxID=22 RepID=UPI0004906EBC|nr:MULTISPECIES: sulfurtransferase TusA family protein [Shewanella]QLE85427.1 response regulator SirA [Shewanella sp. Scap07]
MIFLDLTPYKCPLALVKLKLALKQLSHQQVLSVTLSDSGTRQDVPRFLQKAQYRYRIVSDTPQCCVVEVENNVQ